ncbi:MAG: TonB-dependent receptor plug domain-containing protein [candidate division KSB1 bacterium]|nr:TonB-dependent receptor plug domain-containing protein [candidate division KSB1 bacterium]
MVAHPDSPAVIPDVALTARVLEGKQVSVQAYGDVAKLDQYEVSGARAGRPPIPCRNPLLTLKTLPGVWSVNDQSGKFQVRGGSYDDNLIVINGVEIEQPHLVRKGVMENPSLINPYLVDAIKLRTGAYPVTYGDRLASVLDVTYRKNDSQQWSGQVNVSMVEAGVALFSPESETFNFSTSVRRIDYGHIYKSQHRQGEYNPDFYDWQSLFSWNLSDRHKFSGYAALARSRYRSEPSSVKAVPGFPEAPQYSIHESGQERFDHNTGVLGIQWNADWTKSWSTLVKSSIVVQNEREDTQLYTQIIPLDDEELPDSALTLDGRRESYDNAFTHRQVHVHMRTRFQTPLQQLIFGVEGQWLNQDLDADEAVSGNYQLPGDAVGPVQQDILWNTSGTACFLQYQRDLSALFKINAGARLFRYAFNKETVFMPRLGCRYRVTDHTETAFHIGRYAQPPLYREIQHVPLQDRPALKAQKAWQSTLSLRQTLPNRHYVQMEVYYKTMSDLISYDTYDVRTLYSGQNDAKGYAYGLDAMLFGEFVPDCINWISYGYLIAKEDLIYDSEGWVNRPSAQTHTLSFNLQDKMERFPGSRMHLRILLGSGSYYTIYYSKDDEILTSARNAGRLPLYQRFDLGLTQRFTWKGFKFTFKEEVLNMFDHTNVLSASWFENTLVKTYLSGINYNVGVRVEF